MVTCVRKTDLIKSVTAADRISTLQYVLNGLLTNKKK